jgi:hypothetical protein
MSRQLMIQLLAYQKHVPMLFSCTKHQLQGVWGRAVPGTLWVMGSARGKARSQSNREDQFQ